MKLTPADFFQLILTVSNELFDWMCSNRDALTAKENEVLDALLAFADEQVTA